MRGDCNFVGTDSDLRLFGQNRSGYHNDFSFCYGKVSHLCFKILPYPSVKCRLLRTHVGVKETVGLAQKRPCQPQEQGVRDRNPTCGNRPLSRFLWGFPGRCGIYLSASQPLW